MSRTRRAPTRRGSRSTSGQGDRTAVGNGGPQPDAPTDEVADDATPLADEAEPIEGSEETDDLEAVEARDESAPDDEELVEVPESEEYVESVEYADADKFDEGGPVVDDREMLEPWPPSTWHGPLESITMRPRLFLFPIILFVTIALLIGFVRKPTYTASSQLIVGSITRDFQLNDGQAQAISDLTDIYSRLVGGAEFMEKVDAALGESVPIEAFSAAPIPQSSLIRIDAEGSSQQEALDRADAGQEQLLAYVGELQSDAAQTSLDKLAEYNAAVETAAQKNIAFQAAQNAATGAAPTSQLQLNAQKAEAEFRTAEQQATALGEAYQSLESSSRNGINLTRFASAQPLGSDRRSTLQIYGIGGLLVGALLGMALATLSANRWRLLPTDEEPKVAA